MTNKELDAAVLEAIEEGHVSRKQLGVRLLEVFQRDKDLRSPSFVGRLDLRLNFLVQRDLVLRFGKDRFKLTGRRSWEVRVYADESDVEPIAKWLIEDRTEREAYKEAEADIRREHPEAGDWTLSERPWRLCRLSPSKVSRRSWPSR